MRMLARQNLAMYGELAKEKPNGVYPHLVANAKRMLAEADEIDAGKHAKPSTDSIAVWMVLGAVAAIAILAIGYAVGA